MSNHTMKNKKAQKGGVIPLVAICLILFVSFAAFAIDLGYLFVGRNELQNAADAAALGGARQLGVIYRDMTPVEQSAYNIDISNEWTADDGDGVMLDKITIVNTAQNVASQNQAAREGVVIDSSEIELGIWDPDNPGDDGTPFTGIAEDPTIERPNAVRVTARRNDGNVHGKIATFFSGIFGPDSLPVSARATASLTGQGTSAPGELQLPIGLSRKWFAGGPEEWCGNVVKFSPPTDPDACAGWTGFDLGKSTKNELGDILTGEHIVPTTGVGQDFYYTNGVQVADVFKTLLMLYGMNGYDVDRVYQYDPNKDYSSQEIPVQVTTDAERVPLCYYNDMLTPCNATDIEVDDIHLRYPNLDFDNPDGGNQQKNFTGPFRYAHEWETTMVVYDSDTCIPSQDLPIKGYARVVLYDVGPPDNAYVYARITCDFVSPVDTRGGGPWLGTLGNIPNLVE